MTISSQTKVGELLDREPYLAQELVTLSPGFKKLENPVFRATMAKLASIETAAGFTGIPVEEVMAALRRGVLKDIIRELHAGVPGGSTAIPPALLTRLRDRFGELIANVNGSELASMEQALIAQGMPVEEVQGLCDLHVEVFTPALTRQTQVEIPEGHPLEIFRRENQALEEVLQRLDDLVRGVCVPEDHDDPENSGLLVDLDRFAQASKDFGRLMEWLFKADEHYQRKEHQLFPVLESKGNTGPSQVMWAKDDEVRALLKGLAASLARRDALAFIQELEPAAKAVRDMIFKEEHILFPLVMDTLDQADWARVASGEAGLGYGLVQPEAPASASLPGEAQPGARANPTAGGTAREGRLELSTGSLSLEEARAIFVHLPVDVSFVNAQDEVVFYSDNPDRVFPRTPSVIGRKVQFCHPPKSVHLVQKILDDFRSGQDKHAEFWINLGGRFIYIQYFALRNDAGTYLGCLEVSQDLTRLRSLEGEKRL